MTPGAATPNLRRDNQQLHANFLQHWGMRQKHYGFAADSPGLPAPALPSDVFQTALSPSFIQTNPSQCARAEILQKLERG